MWIIPPGFSFSWRDTKSRMPGSRERIIFRFLFFCLNAYFQGKFVPVFQTGFFTTDIWVTIPKVTCFFTYTRTNYLFSCQLYFGPAVTYRRLYAQKPISFPKIQNNDHEAFKPHKKQCRKSFIFLYLVTRTFATAFLKIQLPQNVVKM